MKIKSFTTILLVSYLFVACQHSSTSKKEKTAQKEQVKDHENLENQTLPKDTALLISGKDSILISKKKVIDKWDKEWSCVVYQFYNEALPLENWQYAINLNIRKSLYRSENQAEYSAPLSQKLIHQSLEAFKKEARQDDITVWSMLDSFIIDDQHAGFACLKSYAASSTGGAHGMYGESYFYVDKTTGKELHLKDFLHTNAAMLKAAESTFRKTVGIPQSKPFDQTEYSFGGKFYLPDNFKITQKGITFSYNPYEVSNWANGIVEFTMTKAQLAPYLKRKID
ncbi:MAG: RsiV family protein [Sphingomonadales bacterium]